LQRGSGRLQSDLATRASGRLELDSRITTAQYGSRCGRLSKMPLHPNQGKPRPINECNSLKIILVLGQSSGCYPTCDVIQWRVFFHRQDAEDHRRFLHRYMPASEFQVVFDVPNSRDLMTKPDTQANRQTVNPVRNRSGR
jgi:hypothetical protein